MNNLSKKRLWHRTASAALACGLLVVGPLAAADSEEVPKGPTLKTFEPVPSSMTIQTSEQRPELGNTLITASLDGEEMERLERETGRTDFIALGAEETMSVLRDDGVFPDVKAGDRSFSALVFADPEQLMVRAEADQQAMEKSRGTNLTFDGRAFDGQVEVSPFSAQNLSRGLPVPFGPAVASLAAPTPGFANGFQTRVLMITDPGVVTDPSLTIEPCGAAPGGSLPAWSFGRLMTDMANPGLTGINPSLFVEDWLNHWLVFQMINTFNVPARTAMQDIIDDWRAASGGGLLDLSIAPFRLLAIVPRVDLRNTTTGGGGYGGASGTNFLDAGEGRFVFAVVDPFNGGCQEMPFTVILEYGVPLNSCTDVKQWAQDWSQLDAMSPGSLAYNNHLQNLTDVFAAAGADPSKPNHSAINQIRTNENKLDPTWELREFRLTDPSPSMLSQTTVANTPDFSFNNTPTVNSIVGGSSMGPFLGGAAIVPTPNTFWDGNPSIPGSGRHDFSLNTCNGCHAGETDTFFVHINPAPTLLPFVPLLSDFLTGTNIIDPGGGSNTVDPVDGTLRFFDDLDRRETDINQVAGMSCFFLHAVNHAFVSSHVEMEGILPVDLFSEKALAEAPAMEFSFDIMSNPGLPHPTKGGSEVTH